jgi:hypothetical protein
MTALYSISDNIDGASLKYRPFKKDTAVDIYMRLIAVRLPIDIRS